LEVKQVDPNELIRPGQVTVRVEIIAAATATTPKSGLEPATEVAAPNFEAERTGATFGIESPNNEL